MEITRDAERILSAIGKLKKASENAENTEKKEGVDLLSLVGKLSKNRARSKSK